MSTTLVIPSPVTPNQGALPTSTNTSGRIPLSSIPDGVTTKMARTTRSTAGSITESGGEIPLSAHSLSGPSSAGTSGKGKRPASAGSGHNGPPSRLSVTTADLGGPQLQDQQAKVLEGNVTLGVGSGAGGSGGSAEKKSGLTAESGSSVWSQGPKSSAISTPNTSLPFPPDVIPRPLTIREAQLVDHLVRLQLFLATAPSAWQQYGTVPTGIENPSPTNPWPPYSTNGTATHSESTSFVSSPHPALNRFLLPNGEYVSCVYWNGLYQITGTDIVRALAFRFEAFGRPVKLATVKKFEEGVFSDLRNLKPGEDSSLEKPKSDFLDLLFKFGCIRTQKKQKVFFWFSVPHDRLFLDALERDLKREKEGLPTTTEIIGEPARSFRWDPSMSLFEQFADSTTTAALESKISTEKLEGASDESFAEPPAPEQAHTVQAPTPPPEESRGPSMPPPPVMLMPLERFAGPDVIPQLPLPTGADRRNNPFTVSLFEGSPGYKQRKKKSNKERSRPSRKGDGFTSGDDEMSASDSESLQKDMGAPDVQQVTTQLYAGPSVPQPSGSNVGYIRPPPQHQPDQQQQHHQMDYEQPIMQQNHGMYPTGPESGTSGMDYNMGTQMQQPMGWHSSTTTAPPLHYSIPYSPYSIPHYRPLPAGSSTSNVAISRHSQQPLGHGNGIEVEQSSNSSGGGANAAARMFRCPLDTCSRLFKRLEHLKRHVRTHTQERPYNCTRCPKRFSRSDNLTQHLKTHEKADRGDRAMSTAEQSESDADFASRLEAQVEAMAGESFHGSAFGDDQSNYGSPAPMAGIRFGSVPVGVRANNMDAGRFSMPPPSIPVTYTPQPGAARLRTASYPYASGGPQFMASPYGSPAMGTPNMQQDQTGYVYRAQTRSPMLAPTQIPQRSMSAQHSSVRQASVSRFAPYPTRMMESTQQQLHAPQPQTAYQHYMPQQQQHHDQQPMQTYQNQQELSQQMQDIGNNFVPQGTPANYGVSPHSQGIHRGDSPAINPLILNGQPMQHQVPSQSSSAVFQPYSAGMASQISHPSHHSNENDASHIPLQSPATLAFEGMVATASYSNTEAAAAGWPMPEGEDQHGGM